MSATNAARLRIAAASVAAVLLVWAAGANATLAILVAFTALIAAGLFLVPKLALVVIAVFLTLQSLFVNLAGGPDEPLGLALHRLHQAFAVAAVLRIAFFLSWEQVKRYRALWLLSAAFVAAGLGSALVARVPLETMALGAFLAVKFPVFLFLALTIPWSERDSERLMHWALWLGPWLLVSGVVVWLLPVDVQRLFREGEESDFTRAGTTVMHGVMHHPNVFGWAAAVTGCYAVAALLAGRRASRPIALGSLGASVLGILGSLRRKPMVALPVAVVYGVWRFARGRRRWAVLTAFALAGSGGAWIAMDRLQAVYQDALTYVDLTSPTVPRVLLYVTGVEIANERFPLGAGFGRFGGYASVWDYSPLYDEYGLSRIYGLTADNPMYAEDTYWPHIAAETGWIGAALLIAYLMWLVVAAGRVARAGPDQATRTLAVAAGLALVEGLVESAAGPVFELPLFALVLAVPLGIVLVRGAVPAGVPEPAPVAAASSSLERE